MSNITEILDAAASGSAQATDALLPLVYDELRRLAAGQMARERPGHTLDATGLVHEAYLRLVGSTVRSNWAGRGHFFAAAAEAMRRVLIESARRKQTAKRGGGARRVELGELDLAIDAAADADELILLDEALSRLSVEDPAAGLLVKLRYFSGLSVEEAAEIAGLSRATAFRHWSFARAWLISEMAGLRTEGDAGTKRSNRKDERSDESG
jgi:RNA polymerase sigma factor (TIGR02999 family)